MSSDATKDAGADVAAAAAPVAAVAFKKRGRVGESAFARKRKAESGEKSIDAAAKAAAAAAAAVDANAMLAAAIGAAAKADDDDEPQRPAAAAVAAAAAASSSSSSDAAAAAARTDRDDRIDSDDESAASGAAAAHDPAAALKARIAKRRRKDNPNVQTTTANKAAAEEAVASLDGAYASKRSGAAVADSHIAVDISGDKLIRTDATRDKAAWKVGPVKAPSNVRAYSRMDYQPDICKDYKETGYCGFGDSCKFMHDRGDYKSGWQLERDWKAEQDAKQRRLMGESVEEAVNYEISAKQQADNDLPWACLICRGAFKNPVVTNCKHYYCESCALARYAKGQTKCFACNAQTNGVFQSAGRLARVQELRDQEAAAAAAAATAAAGAAAAAADGDGEAPANTAAAAAAKPVAPAAPPGVRRAAAAPAPAPNSTVTTGRSVIVPSASGWVI